MKSLHLKKLQEIQQKLLEVRFKDSKDNLIKTIKDKDIVDEILETIKKLPKSKQGTYLQWLVNLYKSNPKEFIINNENILIDLVNYNNALEKNIPGIEKDFLKQVKTFDEFTIFMKSIKDISHNHKRDKINKKDITLLFKNEEWFVLIPHSKEAAIKYGKGTQWCTSALNNNAFDDYSKNGLLIYFINKTTTDKNIAVYFDTDKMEIDSLWNAKDKQITLKTLNSLIEEQIYDKSMDNFYKFLELSKDKNVIFGLNLKKANDLVGQNKEVPKKILMLKNNIDNTVAHYLATYNPNWSTNDREILMLKNQQGNTVAHPLARNNKNWLTNDKEILMLKNKTGDFVAHVLAKYNPDWLTDDKEILMLKNSNGNSVAHNLSWYNPNWTTDDKEILMLKNNYGYFVAHFLAQHKPNWSTEDKEILMLKNSTGNTVAHNLSWYNPNWSTEDKEILMLKNIVDESVADYLVSQR